MDTAQAKIIIYTILNDILEEEVNITDETPLIGYNSLLDSMKLVDYV